jgi:hypothetical protein
MSRILEQGVSPFEDLDDWKETDEETVDVENAHLPCYIIAEVVIHSCIMRVYLHFPEDEMMSMS